MLKKKRCSMAGGTNKRCGDTCGTSSTGGEGAEERLKASKARRARKRRPPPPTRQEYHAAQVEHHHELARQGHLKCFACGTSYVADKISTHPCLDVHICEQCLQVYQFGTFTIADDGHEIYCRMCGNGGAIFGCDERDSCTRRTCPYSFCVECIERNFGSAEVKRLGRTGENFTCWLCDDSPMEELRSRIPGYVAGSKNVLTDAIKEWQQRNDHAFATSSDAGGSCEQTLAPSRCLGTERSHGDVVSTVAGPKPLGVLSENGKADPGDWDERHGSDVSPCTANQAFSGFCRQQPSFALTSEPNSQRKAAEPSEAHERGALGLQTPSFEPEGELVAGEIFLDVDADVAGAGVQREQARSKCEGSRADDETHAPTNTNGANMAPGSEEGGGASSATSLLSQDGRTDSCSKWPPRRQRAAPVPRFKRRMPPGPGRGATIDCSEWSRCATEAVAFAGGSAYISSSGRGLGGHSGGGQGFARASRLHNEYAKSSPSDTDADEEGGDLLSTDSSDGEGDGCGRDSSACEYVCIPSEVRGKGGQRRQPGFFAWDKESHDRHGWMEDLSRGLENAPIQVVNQVDSEPLPYFRYVMGYVMGHGVQQRLHPDSMVCCDCIDGCRDPELCACLRLQAQRDGTYATCADERGVVRRSSRGFGAGAGLAGGFFSRPGSETREEDDEGGGRFYSDDGLLLRERRTIFECHSRCSCNPQKCKNRVVSRGPHLRLQVFRCKEPGKGWGLRCLDTIPAGTFVACYLGEVLRESDVDEHAKLDGDDYLFGLDFCKHQGAICGPTSSGSFARRGSPAKHVCVGLRREALEQASVAGGRRRAHLNLLSGGGSSAPLTQTDFVRGQAVLSPLLREVIDLCSDESGDDQHRKIPAHLAAPTNKKARQEIQSPARSSLDTAPGRAGLVEPKPSARPIGDVLRAFMDATGCRDPAKAPYILQGVDNPNVAFDHFLNLDHSKETPPEGGNSSEDAQSVAKRQDPGADGGCVGRDCRERSANIDDEGSAHSCGGSSQSREEEGNNAFSPRGQQHAPRTPPRGMHAKCNGQFAERSPLVGARPEEKIVSYGSSTGLLETPRGASPAALVRATGDNWRPQGSQGEDLSARFLIEEVSGSMLDAEGGERVDVEDAFEAPGSSSAGMTCSSHGGASSEALVVDAKAYGNVARFMNHSCEANLTKHMVFVESHDARMPRIAFFAPEIIEPMEELTYDYGYVVGAVEGKELTCYCGASSCRGRLL